MIFRSRYVTASVTALVLILFLLLMELAAFLLFRVRPTGNPLAYRADEAALHIYEAQDNWHFYKVKSHYHQKFRSDEFATDVKTNNLGFREDSDYLGEFVDLGFVGDSFTFGHGVNFGERYSDLLRSSYPSYRILSFAPVNGPSPISQYLFLLNNLDMMPRHLIVGLFPWNDLREDIVNTIPIVDGQGRLVRIENKNAKVRSDGFIVRRDASDEPDPVWRNVLRRTHLGSLVLISAQRVVRFWLGLGAAAGNAKGENLPSIASTFEAGLFDETALLGLRYVLHMRDLVQANGGDITIFYIPASYRVGNYPFFCQYISSYSTQECFNLLDTNGLGAALMDWCTRNSLSCIDPTSLYYEKDGHWNKHGHHLAAKILAQYLRHFRHKD
jgi:hypothetical protein